MNKNRRGAVLTRHLTKNKTKLSNFNLCEIKNTKQFFENNSGITMVSLVITIIVMVILASVSLNLITGGEGIFDKAEKAVSEHKKGQEKDILNMAYSSLFLKSNLDDLEINEDIILNEIGQKNVGVVRDEDDEENYIITFTDSRNVYYMNFKTGTVEYTGTYDEEADKIEIKEQDVTFKIEPSDWTNGNVITTIKVSEKIDMTNYVLQWSRNARNWSTYTSGIVSTKNEIIYARIKYNLTGAAKLECSTNIDKIDTRKPTVTVIDSTTNSITFEANDVADTAKGENASGVAGYMIIEGTTTPETPSATATGWTAYNGSSITVVSLTQGNSYNVFVKDNAGNVSEAGNGGTGSVADLTTADVQFTYSPSGWTNTESVTVTAQIASESTVDTTGFTLKLTTDVTTNPSTWKTASEGVTRTTNGEVYAFLVDTTNRKGKTCATGNVDNIDTKKPTVTVTDSTTNSITFNASDVADTAKGENASGVAGYIVQLSSVAAPTKDSNGWTDYDGSSITVGSLTQGNSYNVFVKDNAGNVSEAGNRGTGSVVISKGNISSTVTSWSGTTATVSFTTTTGYYIQTKVGDGSWSANPETTGSATATAITGTTVYARLTDSSGQYNLGDFATETPILTYSVEYNGNGATSGSTASSSHNYGTAKNLTLNGFACNGKHFIGWATSSGGTVVYSNGQSVNNLTETNEAIVTLYAVWEDHIYTSTVTTAATCDTSGVRTYNCVCGASYTEPIAATGHNWIQSTQHITGYGDCGGSCGYYDYYCANNNSHTTTGGNWDNRVNYNTYYSGDTVTLGGERFYVLDDSDGNNSQVTLIARSCLNNSDYSTQCEDSATYNDYKCAFSTSNYWSGESNISYPFNLNTYAAVINDTASAVYRANNYAKLKGAISGRLLTFEEANALKTKASSLGSSSNVYKMLWGKENTGNGYLYYWLGSAYTTNYVWFVLGSYSSLSYGSCDNSSGAGVRPVLTVYKSSLQ